MSPENSDIPSIPERPLECSDCKKPIVVRYTEITSHNCCEYSMCADCPELKKHLKAQHSGREDGVNGEKTELACGDCGTTLEDLGFGRPLGCSHCYEIFGEIILADLYDNKRIPLRVSPKKQGVHIGRSPGETQEMSPSMRLLALNEALDETLKREDYEQAARLRDQIRALTELQKKEKGSKS